MTKLIVIAAIIAAIWWLLSSAKATRKARKAPKPPAPRLGIDEAEARAILGVSAGADAEAIRAAHRRLVGAVHPDRGGSDELARRINAARDVLLKRQQG